MSEKQVNRQAKDVLAKVLATENLTVVHSAKASTAAFFPSTRTLMLPVYDGKLKEPTVNMLIGHEVGHALKSPSGDDLIAACKQIDPKSPNLVRDYLNVIEDIRIERYIKNRYPGLVNDFHEGYQELLDRDLFRIKGKDINSLPLIDRINIFFKAADHEMGIKFSDAELPFVKQAASVRTWSEVIAAAAKLYEFSKTQSQTNQNDLPQEMEAETDDDPTQSSIPSDPEESDSKDTKNGDSEMDDSGADGDDTSEAEESKESKNSKNSKNGKSGSSDAKDAKDAKDDKSQEKSKSKKSAKGAGHKPTSEPVAPGSMTQQAFDSAAATLADPNALDFQYITAPKVKLNKVIVPNRTIRAMFKQCFASNDANFQKIKASFEEFRKENKEKVNFLVMEFNRRKAAADRQREVVSRSGMIDTSRLYSYKFADDIFKTNVTKQVGKNHGLVFFVDFSGSMANNITPTIEQLLCLAMFCRAVAIPFEVYSFGHSSAKAGHTSIADYKDGDLMLDCDFTLNQFFSSEMNNAEFYSACVSMYAIALYYKGGHGFTQHINLPSKCLLGAWTPLTESAMTAPYIVERMREKFHTEFTHVIFLTDGQGHNQYNVYSSVPNVSGSGFIDYEKVVDFYGKNVVFRDTVSKKEFAARNYGNDCNTLSMLLLRARTNSNVIGFYCTGKSAALTAYEAQQRIGSKRDAKAEMDKQNFVSVDTIGYTEYYYIPGGNDLSTSKSSNYTGMMSQEEIQRVMSERAAGRKKNRIILSRFINMIQHTV
jgi:cobalamin biosynthesis protein CobT